MVKTTCVPNTIRIPTHRVNFSHQMLGFGERTWNHQWNHRKVSRGEGRKEQIKRWGRKRNGSEPYSVRWVAPCWFAWLFHKSRHFIWGDSIDVWWNMAVSYITEVDATGATQTDVTPYRHKDTHLSHESRQCIWREYFMRRTNRTEATQRKQILKISLDRVHLKIKIKNRDLRLSLWPNLSRFVFPLVPWWCLVDLFSPVLSVRRWFRLHLFWSQLFVLFLDDSASQSLLPQSKSRLRLWVKQPAPVVLFDLRMAVCSACGPALYVFSAHGQTSPTASQAQMHPFRGSLSEQTQASMDTKLSASCPWPFYVGSRL
jgi:hypothetical protein